MARQLATMVSRLAGSIAAGKTPVGGKGSLKKELHDERSVFSVGWIGRRVFAQYVPSKISMRLKLFEGTFCWRAGLSFAGGSILGEFA
jgi:hypothetical protein